MIRFSIITCTYNAVNMLQRTLDSVAQQSWTQVEHIIVDGASTDGTADMIRRYADTTQEDTENGHTVAWTSEPDSGLYDAMNKGISRATGDYMVFLNAGDTFPSPTTLEHIFTYIEERCDSVLPAVLYGDTDIVDDGGRFLRHRRLAPPEKLGWRSFRHGMLVCHQAFYVRTDIAKAESYDLRYRFSADVGWCIRVMKRAERMQLPLLRLPEVVANYLDGGMTGRNRRASLIERFRIMCRHYGTVRTVCIHVWFVLRALLKK